MTPFRKAGYRLHDRFHVVEDNVDQSGYTTDDIIILYWDDNSDMPQFSLLNGKEVCYVQLKNIVKINE